MQYNLFLKADRRAAISSILNYQKSRSTRTLIISCPGINTTIDAADSPHKLLAEIFEPHGYSTLRIDMYGLEEADVDTPLRSYLDTVDTLSKIIRKMQTITEEEISDKAIVYLDSESPEGTPAFDEVILLGTDEGSRLVAEAVACDDLKKLPVILVSPKCINGIGQFENISGKRNIYMRIAERYESCPVDLYMTNSSKVITKNIDYTFFKELDSSEPAKNLAERDPELNSVYCREEELETLKEMGLGEGCMVNILTTTEKLLESITRQVAGRELIHSHASYETPKVLDLAIGEEIAFQSQVRGNNDEPIIGVYN